MTDSVLLIDAPDASLWRAAQIGNVQWMQQILLGHVPILSDDGPKQAPPLMPALDSSCSDNERLQYAKRLARAADSKGLTALHWAAGGNYVPMAQLLLSYGALVDAVGGDLTATPLHWATRQGHLQMVTCLFQHGADIRLADGQGYEPLHIAAHVATSLHLLLYFIYLPRMNVNALDQYGRTALMWLCYKGAPCSALQLLLDAGAHLDLVDASGDTALHWAVIQGHESQSLLLLARGARRNIADQEGKTPAMWAKERNYDWYFEAVAARGWQEETSDAEHEAFIPNAKQKKWILHRYLPIAVWSTFSLNRICYFIPHILFPFSLFLLVHVTVLVSIPVIMFLLFAVTRILEQCFNVEGKRLTLFGEFDVPNATDRLFGSPLLTAIMQSTFLWVALFYLTWMMPNLGENPWKHLLFIVSFICMIYHYCRVLFMDPGFISCGQILPVEQRTADDPVAQSVLSLASLGRLDARHFCITCRVMKPLRSKHCRVCERCVARMDHHCPWTHNCVALKNHSSFVLFLVSGEIAIWTWFLLGLDYLDRFSSENVLHEDWCRLAAPFCTILIGQRWLILLLLWVAFNATWCWLLVGLQMYQVAAALTTNESTTWHRLEYLQEKSNSNESNRINHFFNPFDRGWMLNCLDFWGWSSHWSHINWFTIQELREQEP